MSTNPGETSRSLREESRESPRSMFDFHRSDILLPRLQQGSLFMVLSTDTTLEADCTWNKQFMRHNLFAAAGLCVLLLFLAVAPPSKVVVTSQSHDGEFCRVTNCSETIGFLLRDVSPLNREAKIQIRLPSSTTKSEGTNHHNHAQLYSKIVSVKIYAYRDQEIAEQALSVTDVDDMEQCIDDYEPVWCAGRLHVLSEQHYAVLVSLNGLPTQDFNQVVAECILDSKFRTMLEMFIRYICFVWALFILGATRKAPKILQLILVTNANPFMFIEIGLPNIISSLISDICSSFYIFYLAFYFNYNSKKEEGKLKELVMFWARFFLVGGVYVCNVLRLQAISSRFLLKAIEYVLASIVISLLGYNFWTMLSTVNLQLHRDLLFVATSIFYFSLLSLITYIVPAGWSSLVKYLVFHLYGMRMCYLTRPMLTKKDEPLPKWRSLVQIFDKGQIAVKGNRGTQNSPNVTLPMPNNELERATSIRVDSVNL